MAKQKNSKAKKTKQSDAKQNNKLKVFFKNLKDAAISFGFVDNKDGKGNGLLRDCIHKEKNNDEADIRTPNDQENNFWFGFIREEQGEAKAYEGLSFVVFPESNGNTNCVVSIGIGSSTTADDNVGGGSLGPDLELAMKLSFVRSFRSLTNAGNSGAHFFFKLDFTETSNPTPGLKEALEDTTQNYDPVMVNTVSEYDHKKRGGLLPAAMLVNYSSEDGYNLIVSWLAQYAYWRNWSSYNNGTIKAGKARAITDAINKCKTEKESLNPEKVLEILQEKRFIVLQGAPGCGKTWTANKISEYDFFKNIQTGKSNTRFIQFHAETSYADFIYGIKPKLDGKTLAYSYQKGTLLKILDEALNDKDNKYLLIIDEINRANLANVLGPVFYLFEQTAENRTHQLTLGLNKRNEPIEYDHIPNNLYVVATMNTADKSLAVVDFALRRRFAWITLRPHTPDLPNIYVINGKLHKKIDANSKDSNCVFDGYFFKEIDANSDDSDYVFDGYLFKKIDAIFDEYATDEELNLQPGQSYFIYPKGNVEAFKKHRKDAIQYGIMPLVKEYISEGYLLAAKDTFAQLFYDYGVVMYE